MKKIKIILADDHSILQEGLCISLEREKSFEVVAMADSGYKAIELATFYQPDVIIMDVSMPELNGMEATKQILAKHPEIKIIALSMHMEKIYVTGMMNAGASGYILKICSFKELLKCIQIVLSGKIFLYHEIRHLVKGNDGNLFKNKRVSAFSLLSRREREVLQLIAEGHKRKEIAKKLKISIKTADIHRTHLKAKLNIHSVPELTKFAIIEGVTSSLI
ncbi:response regulator [Desulfobacula phenolica]|uniref:Two component transcriptional regulator, LuxR family n=1 Tax=Desulfobacula phenolica TaxID=90732 RepID=A0A1H2EKM8_9BACT|nr:response regulator transcription factor [Desulfobacula phenolica]SDT95624.1 two component transcriptional regulator, LuxR family [Desulfobacula phenolica]